MKRVLVLPALGILLALSLFASGAGATGTGDTNGPACRDLVSGNFTYSTGNVFAGSISINAPACKNVTYTVVIESMVGTTTTTTSLLGTPGPDPTLLLLDPTTIADDDGTLCVYVTSSTGGHIVDRGPDAGCLPVVLESGSGGGQSFS
jgi:hypothetical protein